MIKKLFVEDIGELVLSKNKRSKRLTISIKPNRPVRITMPYSVSYDFALSFLMSRKEQVLESRKKLEAKQKKQVLFLPGTTFSTYTKSLRFVHSPDCSPSIRIEEKFINIVYPNVKDIEKEEFQNSIKGLIINTLKTEAKAFLPGRTQILAEQHGFSYNKIGVRNARTRWGSCSGQNNISLNIHLMRLPEELRDYVILHELCHTVEKNHSKRFWLLMQKVSPDSLKHNQELKKYNPAIF